MYAKRSGGSSGRAAGYCPRGAGFDSQAGPNQIFIPPLCPSSTKWSDRLEGSVSLSEETNDRSTRAPKGESQVRGSSHSRALVGSSSSNSCLQAKNLGGSQ
ncbi:hypothetical protein PoB_003275100 [Plakobranchus ocellatus]|uniref:Uncharacterized protein n=1 Tax=Plakobranchus ocellatus TaxID=259542 RepID=A0AAV4ACZ6_9GAST|nr:hypothetical protein PoB_003275100 [Plakobranchus ocellatus]